MAEIKPANADKPKSEEATAETRERDSYLLKDRAEGSIWERYLQAVALGMTKADCAAYAKVGASTARRWVNEADEAEEEGRENVFTEFAGQVRSKRAEMIARNIGTVEVARRQGDWKAASWLLERHGYNKTTEVQANVAASLTYTIDNQDVGC